VSEVPTRSSSPPPLTPTRRSKAHYSPDTTRSCLVPDRANSADRNWFLQYYEWQQPHYLVADIDEEERLVHEGNNAGCSFWVRHDS